MTSLVVSKASVSEGLAFVAIQSKVWVSSFDIDSSFFWFSASFLPKTTARGVMSMSEARLIACDVLRDSFDDTKKTRVRIKLVIRA